MIEEGTIDPKLHTTVAVTLTYAEAQALRTCAAVGYEGCEEYLSAEEYQRARAAMKKLDAAVEPSARPSPRAVCEALFNRWSNTAPGSPHRVLDDDDAALLRAAVEPSACPTYEAFNADGHLVHVSIPEKERPTARPKWLEDFCPDDCTNTDLGCCPECFKKTGLGCPHGPICDACRCEDPGCHGECGTHANPSREV